MAREIITSVVETENGCTYLSTNGFRQRLTSEYDVWALLNGREVYCGQYFAMTAKEAIADARREDRRYGLDYANHRAAPSPAPRGKAKAKRHIKRDDDIAECGMLLSVIRTAEDAEDCQQCITNVSMVWDGYGYVDRRDL